MTLVVLKSEGRIRLLNQGGGDVEVVVLVESASLQGMGDGLMSGTDGIDLAIGDVTCVPTVVVTLMEHQEAIESYASPLLDSSLFKNSPDQAN